MMSMETFKASVQYGDYKGTAAADAHDSSTINDYMIKQGLMGKGDQIVGVKLWSGEVHGHIQNKPVDVTVYLINSPGFDEVRNAIDGTTPVLVREVRFEIGLEEFFGLFKRFEIAITRFDQLIGRELSVEN